RLRSRRNCWNAMKESREPRYMQVSTTRWSGKGIPLGLCVDIDSFTQQFSSRIDELEEMSTGNNPDIPVGTRGDRYDRYCICVEEMRQSVQIIVQCINQIPSSMIKVNDRKLCPPSRSRMKLSMESCAV
ncbi:NADH dehydrogenase, partial [Datura stramonium]|nr:NADH dehydrogenase [ubiquinone] iron-sulfur protein 2 [Datura stramonium]